MTWFPARCDWREAWTVRQSRRRHKKWGGFGLEMGRISKSTQAASLCCECVYENTSISPLSSAAISKAADRVRPVAFFVDFSGSLAGLRKFNQSLPLLGQNAAIDGGHSTYRVLTSTNHRDCGRCDRNGVALIIVQPRPRTLNAAVASEFVVVASPVRQHAFDVLYGFIGNGKDRVPHTVDPSPNANFSRLLPDTSCCAK